MSFLCKIIKHNWSYKQDKIHIHSSLGDDKAHITLTKRLCKRCYKKQVQVLDTGNWEDIELSVDELREMKLKKLGV
jgi:hypothetical protein